MTVLEGAASALALAARAMQGSPVPVQIAPAHMKGEGWIAGGLPGP